LVAGAIVVVTASAMRLITPDDFRAGCRFARDVILILVTALVGRWLLPILIDWARPHATSAPARENVQVPARSREAFTVRTEPQRRERVVV
jgi:NhaP-type Na+/H+ or K+/H+ antiporter